MKTLLWVAVIALAGFPFSAAAPNPMPAMTISMDPSALTVNATAAQVSAVFNGEVMMDKLQVQTVTVDLVSSVDIGLAIGVEPHQMTFTTTEPQTFTCTVKVPLGTPLTYAQVYVNATGKTTLFTITGSCAAILYVDGPAPPHSSGNTTSNSTKNQTRPGEGNPTSSSGTGNDANFLLGMSKERFMLVAASATVIVIVVAAGGYRLARRKRARGQED